MYQLRERRLTFAGHCYRCEDQPVKHLVLWEGRAGRMLRGQTNRMTYVKQLLRDSCCETVDELQQMMNKSSAVAEMGDNRHGPKRRGAAVPLSPELGPRLAQCGLGRDLLPYQAASSSIQPFGHNRYGPKIGWCVRALFLGVAGSTSNTMSRRPRPTSVPSGILMHPGVPQ